MYNKYAFKIECIQFIINSEFTVNMTSFTEQRDYEATVGNEGKSAYFSIRHIGCFEDPKSVNYCQHD